MKTSTFITLFGLAMAPLGLAESESLEPSPTESFGCEPHGDHWHCEGHVSETAALDSTVSPPTPTGDHEHEDDHDHDHDHDHETETGSEDPGPSPTASIGCEPHGDHWHCEGPAETNAAETPASSEDPGPSPTASVGCEPHGDHWHCEGPATSTPTPTGESEEGGDGEGGVAAQLIPLAGALAAAVLAF